MIDRTPDTSGDDGEFWFRLDAVVAGERVSDWLHAGRVYRGTPIDDDHVRLFAPDSSISAVIDSSLLSPAMPPPA